MAQEKGVDMVVGNFDKVFDNWGVIRKKPELYHCHLTDKRVTKAEVMPLMMGLENNHANGAWGVYVWGRIYKRKCILDALSSNQELLFPISKEMKSEDDAFNIAISSYLESIWITNTIVSHYRYGGVSSGDMPYVRKGGYLYDERSERCFLYRCKQVLPLIYERYVIYLKKDVVKQLHFHISSEKQLYDFVEKEMNERKIVLWARQNIVSIPDNAIDKDLQQAVLENDVHKIIECAYEWEGFLQRVHYPKMKWVGVYQRIVDKIGTYL